MERERATVYASTKTLERASGYESAIRRRASQDPESAITIERAIVMRVPVYERRLIWWVVGIFFTILLGIAWKSE